MKEIKDNDKQCLHIFHHFRKGEEYFEKVYLKPWSRAGPWVIGIWLGYIFHKQGKERFVLKQVQTNLFIFIFLL